MMSPFTTQQQQLAALIAQQQSMYMAAAAAAQNLQATAVLEGQNRTSGNTKPVVTTSQGGPGRVWPSTNTYSTGGFFASGAENGGLSSQVSILTRLGLFPSTVMGALSMLCIWISNIDAKRTFRGSLILVRLKSALDQCKLPLFWCNGVIGMPCWLGITSDLNGLVSSLQEMGCEQHSQVEWAWEGQYLDRLQGVWLQPAEPT